MKKICEEINDERILDILEQHGISRNEDIELLSKVASYEILSYEGINYIDILKMQDALTENGLNFKDKPLYIRSNPLFFTNPSVPFFGTPSPNIYGGAPFNNPNKSAFDVHNWMTPSEYKEINRGKFTLTREEHIKAICNHRKMNGYGDAIITDPDSLDGICDVCKEKVMLLDDIMDDEEIMTKIEESVDFLSRVLDSAKLLYVDFPEEEKDFFDIKPMMQKIPELWRCTKKSVSKYECHDTAMNLLNEFRGAINDNEEEE